jgi:hypothetical protein
MADRFPPLRLAAACSVLAALECTGAQALTVNAPYVDVVSVGTGTDVTSSGGVLTMTGTSTAVFASPGVILTSLAPEATFTLTATYSPTLTATESPGSNTYDFTSGTLTINNGTDLLDATFSDLKLTALSTALFQLAVGSSPLVYTGGSLAGTVGTGAIVGSLTLTSYTAGGSGVADLSQNFQGNNLTAKIGATAVPLPGSLSLLLTGLLGAGALTVRNRSARTWQIPDSSPADPAS